MPWLCELYNQSDFREFLRCYKDYCQRPDTFKKMAKGQTYLMWAVFLNRHDMVEEILNHLLPEGICVLPNDTTKRLDFINACDEAGRTALDYAILLGNENPVETLIEAGCVVKFKKEIKKDVKRIIKAARFAAEHEQYKIADRLIRYWLLGQPTVGR